MNFIIDINTYHRIAIDSPTLIRHSLYHPDQLFNASLYPVRVSNAEKHLDGSITFMIDGCKYTFVPIHLDCEDLYHLESMTRCYSTAESYLSSRLKEGMQVHAAVMKDQILIKPLSGEYRDIMKLTDVEPNVITKPDKCIIRIRKDNEVVVIENSTVKYVNPINVSSFSIENNQVVTTNIGNFLINAMIRQLACHILYYRHPNRVTLIALDPTNSEVSSCIFFDPSMLELTTKNDITLDMVWCNLKIQIVNGLIKSINA